MERQEMERQKMERQKIEERFELTFEEKLDIGKKSNNLCCHCGAKLRWSMNASVDHFVPLNQGGTSRKINLIALCKDCNKEKNDKIYPTTYLKYLKPEFLKEISDYFDSYTHSFEFFHRRNVVACDCYEMHFTLDYLMHNKNNRRKHGPELQSTIIIRRARAEDLIKVTDYYVEYLKKVGCLDNETTARHNIQFWFNFAAIYFVEKDNNIVNLCVICLCKNTLNEERSEDDLLSVRHFLSILIMPKYNNFVGYSISKSIVTNFPDMIMKEQELAYIPVDVMTIGSEKFIGKFASNNNYPVVPWNRFYQVFFIKSAAKITDHDASKLNESVEAALGRFDADTDKMLKYLDETGHIGCKWMLSYINRDIIDTDET